MRKQMGLDGKKTTVKKFYWLFVQYL